MGGPGPPVQPRRGYTTAQLLRFPILFGSILGAFCIAFSYRRVYFHDEIQKAKEKNEIESREMKKIIEAARMNFEKTNVKKRRDI